MACKRINITIPSELLVELDKAVSGDRISRSAYICEAVTLLHKLQLLTKNRTISDESVRCIVEQLYRDQAYRQYRFNMLKLSYAEIQD